jgi:hypothetical protein
MAINLNTLLNSTTTTGAVNLKTVFPYLAVGQITHLSTKQISLLPQLPRGIIPAGGLYKPSNTPTGSITGENTLTALTNLNISHVCDVTADLRRSAAYQRLKDSAFIRGIREAIKATLTARSLLPTGATTWLVEQLRTIKDILKKINDFLKLVKAIATILVVYITIIRAVINWILTLPALLLQMAKECLYAFFNSIVALGKDLLGISADNILGPEYQTLLSEMKSTFNEAKNVIKNTVALGQIPAQILNASLNTNISLNPSQALAAFDKANADLSTALGTSAPVLTTTSVTTYSSQPVA